MSRILLIFTLFMLLSSACIGAVLSIRESTGTLRSVDPAVELLPDSSLQDFSYLLQAPAGKFGYVQTRSDGHFYFENGKRVRFWGVNISSLSLRQPHERIEQVVGTLARAGVNIVRLEAVDNRNCLLDESKPDSKHFDSEYLDRLDYWIYQFKKHGIYYYINLLDFRTFKDGDGVENASKLDRAAKPYSLFSRKLINLQKEFAEDFLCNHVNPYTKLPLAKDPGMALVELVNENGVLSRGDKWPTLVEPYGAELQIYWNQWLKDRYRTTEMLSSVWTNGKGEKALASGESLDNNTVALPSMAISDIDSVTRTAYTDPLRSPARRNDACAFGYELLRRYCKEMKEFLVSKGVRVPVSAVVGGQYIPETRAVADELDFTSENFYYDHPFWDPGKDWSGPAYYWNTNQLQSDAQSTFAPWCAGYHWKKKPVAVREWTTVWPNQYRAASVPEAAAMASVQGIDCMVLFGYSLRVLKLGDFACQSDPTRWGLMGIGAKIFLEGDIEEEKTGIEVVYSDRDLFNYYHYLTPLYTLAWSARLVNAGVGEADREGKVLRVVAGRGGLPADPGRFSVIFSQYPYGDLYQRSPLNSDGTYAGYKIALAEAPDSRFTFNGLMYNPGVFDVYTRRGFSVADVNAKGFKPIGLSMDGAVCLGFYDPQRENYVFRDIQTGDVRRIALDALSARNPKFPGHRQVDTGIHQTPGDQVRRDIRNGLFYFRSSQSEAISGALPQAASDGELKVTTATPFGTIMAASLDGKPLATSTHYVVKMVSIARNTGEKVTRMKGKIQLEKGGDAPVVTDGKLSDTPTVVTIGGRKIIEIGLVNGTWELLHQDGRTVLFCDTPNVPVTLPGSSPSGSITAYGPDNIQLPVPLERRFRYPAGARYVEVNSRLQGEREWESGSTDRF